MEEEGFHGVYAAGVSVGGNCTGTGMILPACLIEVGLNNESDKLF